MKKPLYCPNCNKSDGMKISIPFHALLRANINSKGEVQTGNLLQKFTGAKEVFNLYASIDTKEDMETRVFLIPDDKEREFSVYCNKCSNIFYVSGEEVRLNSNA